MSSKDIVAFLCDPNFCTACGAILPLPDQSDYIRCKVCGSTINITSLEGIQIHSYKSYNQEKIKTAEELSRTKNIIDAEDFGPVVKRRCPKCNYRKMTYTTRQTRSADEGQTVFYTCVKCHFTETEHS